MGTPNFNDQMRQFPPGIHFQSVLGAGTADPKQHRRQRPLDVEALRPPLADRSPGRPAHGILLRSLAERRAEQPKPAAVRRTGICGTSSTRRAASRSRMPTAACSSPAPSKTTRPAGSGSSPRPTACGGTGTSNRPISSRGAATTSSSTAGTWIWRFWDQDRWYSGPIGSRALVIAAPRRRQLRHPKLLLVPAGRIPLELRVRCAAAIQQPAASVRPGDDDGRLSGRPARFGEEPLQRVLPPGQLQPPGSAQLDGQRRRAARASKHVRLPRKCLPRREEHIASIRRGARSAQRRPFQDFGLLWPVLRGGSPRHRRPVLRRRGHPGTPGRSVLELRHPKPVCLGWLPEPVAELQRPACGATTGDLAGGGYTLANNGSNYPVQANLAGQYHNEVVATAERQIIEDLTVRLDYQHRWLGNIIEDGTADPVLSTSVLANPGNVPDSAIQAAQHDAPGGECGRHGQPERRESDGGRYQCSGEADDPERAPSGAEAGAHLRRHHPLRSTSGSRRTGWRALPIRTRV